ncbi:hypothetical protein [Amycolatopsis sp. NPDC001319]
MEAAHEASPLDERRWSYEHAFGLLRRDHLDSFKRLGVIIAANPLLS